MMDKASKNIIALPTVASVVCRATSNHQQGREEDDRAQQTISLLAHTSLHLEQDHGTAQKGLEENQSRCVIFTPRIICYAL